MQATLRSRPVDARFVSVTVRRATVAASFAIASCGDVALTTPQVAEPADPLVVSASATMLADVGWSAPEHLGNVVNSSFADAHPAVSANELSLYFTAGQGRGGEGGRDLWVSRRATPQDAWGDPVNLGAVVNSPRHEDNPSLSPDGRSLYFSSNRAGHGGFDLFVSHRADPDDDLGWGPPMNLGAPVNSEHDETDAAVVVVAGPGGQSLYFASDRDGTADLYVAPRRSDGTYGPATMIAELSSGADDLNPTVIRDGRTIYFASNRPGSLGLFDLWVATRQSPAHPWSAPENLGSPINGADSNDVGPELSADGHTLYFASAFRAGNMSVMYDLWRIDRR